MSEPRDYDEPSSRTARRSLVSLVTELPQLFLNLVRAEFEQLKAELIRKAKHAGVGIGFFLAAVAVALLLLPVLIAAGVLGFATIVPGWAAALIMAGIMVVAIALFAFLGILSFRRIGRPAPETTIDSVRDDIDAVKGRGDYDF